MSRSSAGDIITCFANKSRRGSHNRLLYFSTELRDKYGIHDGSWFGMRYNGFAKTITILPDAKELQIRILPRSDRPNDPNGGPQLVEGWEDLKIVAPGSYCYIGDNVYQLAGDMTVGMTD